MATKLFLIRFANKTNFTSFDQRATDAINQGNNHNGKCMTMSELDGGKYVPADDLPRIVRMLGVLFFHGRQINHQHVLEKRRYTTLEFRTIRNSLNRYNITSIHTIPLYILEVCPCFAPVSLFQQLLYLRGPGRKNFQMLPAHTMSLPDSIRQTSS